MGQEKLGRIEGKRRVVSGSGDWEGVGGGWLWHSFTGDAKIKIIRGDGLFSKEENGARSDDHKQSTAIMGGIQSKLIVVLSTSDRLVNNIRNPTCM